jgi:chaperonin GroEL
LRVPVKIMMLLSVIEQAKPALLKVELEDPLENLGVKLVRQAGARTNDIAGDGCTTSIILAQGLIAEGMKVCSDLPLF